MYKECSSEKFTEPIFKEYGILNLKGKLVYNRSTFMHKYRHNKLPESFSGIFTEISDTSEIQIRQNDFNYQNKPAKTPNLENFPMKKLISNWNFLSIDLKSTGELDEFQALLKETLLHKYSFETDCPSNCFSCN